MNEPEAWAEFPEFPGYRISTRGRAARLTPDREPEIIKPILKDGRLYYRMRKNGKRPMRLADRAVATAFMEGFAKHAPAMKLRHINGDLTDCRLENLEMESKKAGRKVLKIDAEGRILAEYRNAAEAGRKNYMSYQTVVNRCTGKTRDHFEDGFSFRYEGIPGRKRT